MVVLEIVQRVHGPQNLEGTIVPQIRSKPYQLTEKPLMFQLFYIKEMYFECNSQKACHRSKLNIIVCFVFPMCTYFLVITNFIS